MNGSSGIALAGGEVCGPARGRADESSCEVGCGAMAGRHVHGVSRHGRGGSRHVHGVRGVHPGLRVVSLQGRARLGVGVIRFGECHGARWRLTVRDREAVTSWGWPHTGRERFIMVTACVLLRLLLLIVLARQEEVSGSMRNNGWMVRRMTEDGLGSRWWCGAGHDTSGVVGGQWLGGSRLQAFTGWVACGWAAGSVTRQRTAGAWCGIGGPAGPGGVT